MIGSDCERVELPVTWDFWQHFDRSMLQRADALEVLMLDGWHRSVGVTAEINFARGLGLPVVFREFVVKAPVRQLVRRGGRASALT